MNPPIGVTFSQCCGVYATDTFGAIRPLGWQAMRKPPAYLEYSVVVADSETIRVTAGRRLVFRACSPQGSLIRTSQTKAVIVKGAAYAAPFTALTFKLRTQIECTSDRRKNLH